MFARENEIKPENSLPPELRRVIFQQLLKVSTTDIEKVIYTYYRVEICLFSVTRRQKSDGKLRSGHEFVSFNRLNERTPFIILYNVLLTNIEQCQYQPI
jgi:hypothetical protein